MTKEILNMLEKDEILVPGEPTYNELLVLCKDALRALAICANAASGSTFAWPESEQHEHERGTELGPRVNQVGKVANGLLASIRNRDSFHNRLWTHAVIGSLRGDHLK